MMSQSLALAKKPHIIVGKTLILSLEFPRDIKEMYSYFVCNCI